MNRTDQQSNTTDIRRKAVKLTLNRETIQDLTQPQPTNSTTGTRYCPTH